METWDKCWTKVAKKSLGSGGNGTTYKVVSKAEAEGPIRVLKLLRDEKANRDQRRARFRQEVEALQAVEHERVPTIIDHNVGDSTDDGETLHFVCTLFPGKQLEDLFAQSRPSVDQAVKCVARLCEILDYCHQQELLHRDIKPQNVIAVDDDWSDPALVDFGLSFHEDLPRYFATVDERVGNYFCRLPEHEQNVDPPLRRNAASDVTMVAGLLLYLLTGVKPGQLVDGSDVLPHRRTEAHAALTKVGPGVARFITVFDRTFKPSIGERIQTALELRDLIVESKPVIQSRQLSMKYHELERLGYPVKLGGRLLQ